MKLEVTDKMDTTETAPFLWTKANQSGVVVCPNRTGEVTTEYAFEPKSSEPTPIGVDSVHSRDSRYTSILEGGTT